MAEARRASGQHLLVSELIPECMQICAFEDVAKPIFRVPKPAERGEDAWIGVSVRVDAELAFPAGSAELLIGISIRLLPQPSPDAANSVDVDVCGADSTKKFFCFLDVDAFRRCHHDDADTDGEAALNSELDVFYRLFEAAFLSGDAIMNLRTVCIDGEGERDSRFRKRIQHRTVYLGSVRVNFHEIIADGPCICDETRQGRTEGVIL